MKPHGLLGRLPLIRARTLVVHGEDDGLVPRVYAEEFARRIPGASLATIEGAGHLPMLEREPEFSELLKEFLA